LLSIYQYSLNNIPENNGAKEESVCLSVFRAYGSYCRRIRQTPVGVQWSLFFRIGWWLQYPNIKLGQVSSTSYL